MVEDYRALAVFAAVADTGGFTAAGRALKLSTSVVSHHVSRLEDRLGAALFFRSTRSLSLTPEGARLLPAARRMVEAGRDALDALAEDGRAPVGALRVALPAFGGAKTIMQKLWGFARENPMVALSLNMSDTQIDLVKDGFDVAIRLGKLEDSALRTRKVGEFSRVLVASPGYLEARPPVTTPADLAQLDFIAMARLPEGFTLQKGRTRAEVLPKAVRVEVNSVGGARDAILAGVGLQRIPLSEVQDDLESGALVRVLPDWSLPVSNIYAVWPATAKQKNLTRLFIDHIAAKAPRA